MAYQKTALETIMLSDLIKEVFGQRPSEAVWDRIDALTEEQFRALVASLELLAEPDSTV